MIQVSWQAVAGFIVFVAVAGPGFYWVGRLSKQVDQNTKNVAVIFSQLQDIHLYVKNGRK